MCLHHYYCCDDGRNPRHQGYPGKRGGWMNPVSSIAALAGTKGVDSLPAILNGGVIIMVYKVFSTRNELKIILV